MSNYTLAKNLMVTQPVEYYIGITIKMFILLTDKFLPFDWLRAEVFQLNYSSYGNPKSPNILVAQVTQKWQKDFENQENQELKGSMSGPSGPETRTSKPICSPKKRNNSKKINSWR